MNAPNPVATLEELVEAAPSEEAAFIRWQAKWLDEARPKQLQPDGDWTVWLNCAGRGYGKSRLGCEWIGAQAVQNPGTRWLVSARTIADLRATVFEGESGLCSVIPRELIIPVNGSPYHKSLFEMRVRTLGGGPPSLIKGISAEKPEAFRGPQFHGGLLDEFAAWEKMSYAWDMILFGMRLGDHPKIVITTTPRPKKLLGQMVRNEMAYKVVTSTGSSYENLDNLAGTFAAQLKQYEGTQIGRQEVYAEILDSMDTGIIRRAWFPLYSPNLKLPAFDQIVMSLDTAFTEDARAKKDSDDQETKAGDPDFTFCTVWGYWANRAKKTQHCMLLDAWQARLGLPDLLKRVRRELKNVYGGEEQKNQVRTPVGPRILGGTGRRPDLILIEDKGSGISLRQMLAREIDDKFIIAYNPGKASKLERLHSVSHIVASGMVFLPEGKMPNNAGFVTGSGRPAVWGDIKGEWLEPVDAVGSENIIETLLEQLTTFKGKDTIEHDDGVDSFSQAIRHFADWYGISTKLKPNKSELDEDRKLPPKREFKRAYG